MKTLGCNLVQAVVRNNKNRPGQHSPSASRQQSSWRRVSPLTCGGAQVFSDYQTLWLWSWRQEPSWLQDRPAPLERPLRPPGNKYHQQLIQEKVVKTSYRRITWCALVSAFPVWLVATISSDSSSSCNRGILKEKPSPVYYPAGVVIIIISSLLFISGGNLRVQGYAHAIAVLLQANGSSVHGVLQQGFHSLWGDLSLKQPDCKKL